MDGLDGTWDDTSGTVSITAASHCDFVNFNNECYITNGTDVPFKYTGAAAATNIAQDLVDIGLTKAKYLEEFNNYLFFGNVEVSSTTYQTRIYWSGLKDTTSWSALDFIEIGLNDGQEITGIKKLSDRLVIFKTRSIYNLFFTGDSDIPFILKRSNSSVGCIAPWSIQELENGLVFLSYDGLYFYDGNNSFKVSDKVNTTIKGFNQSRFSSAVSLVQKDKNRYMLATTSSGATSNNRVLVWDYFNKAFSIYVGINAADMATFYIGGTDERPYFGDYSGYTYRADTGSDDYPLNAVTAIDAYYVTNWKFYKDIVNIKQVPHVYMYYAINNAVLTLSYSFEFETGDQYSQTFSTATSSDVYGTGLYGTATYSSAGNGIKRRDLMGSGRVIRFKIANSVAGETFTIHGIGQHANLETNK